jgi:hypothetical protein
MPIFVITDYLYSYGEKSYEIRLTLKKVFLFWQNLARKKFLAVFFGKISSPIC